MVIANNYYVIKNYVIECDLAMCCKKKVFWPRNFISKLILVYCRPDRLHYICSHSLYN